MVRATAKQTPDEKKEAKKKSSSANSSNAKKKPDTGSWPCKMDGCKKVFAREADLKRHQRTTKTHSVPGFQCPQCDATFTRTDALRRHQKSRHNGVVIEPSEPDKGKHSGDGASSGSRSPSPMGSPSRSQEEGSPNDSPSAGQSNPGSSSRTSSYYRPHTMQDGYYAGYPPPPRPPPPGMMMDPHYPPPPIGIPTSATRGNWHPAPTAPPWGPDGHPVPPPGMYIPSYYPSPYYRHPGMPVPTHMPPQISPELLAQSNGQSNGVGPPESALRNTSADSPQGGEEPDDDLHISSGPLSGAAGGAGTEHPVEQHEPPSQDQMPHGGGPQADNNEADEGPDASTLMAAAALQAVLAFQKEQEIREAAGRKGSSESETERELPTQQRAPQAPAQPQAREAGTEAPADAGRAAGNVPKVQNVEIQQPAKIEPVVVPVHASAQEDADLNAAREPNQGMSVQNIVQNGPPPMEQLVTEDGTPMLNPAELLTQESLASPPPS